MPITRCGSAVACGRSPPWPPAARPGGHGRRAASTWCNAAATVGWLVAVVFVCMPTVGVVAATGDVRQRLRRRAQDQPLDEQSWSNLRRFVCGSVENVKCMNDERFNQLRPDFLRKLAARFNQFVPIATAAASPIATTNMIPLAGDTLPELYTNDVNIWNSLNLSGRREGPFYVDEPDFVLTQEQSAMPSRMFDYVSDPFIPQRGRRRLTEQHGRDTRPGLTMTTHLNGGGAGDIARHIHQVSRSAEHKMAQQQQQQSRTADRVDDNANFRRFLRRLLMVSPGDVLAAGSRRNDINDNADNADTSGEEKSNGGLDDGLEVQASQESPPIIQPLQQSTSSQHNLSPPQTSSSVMQLAAQHHQQQHHHVSSAQRNASRDTFYLARGSHIRQP